MRLRVRPDLFATSLFATLGLLPLAACGGNAEGGDDGGGSGATTSAGSGGRPSGSGGSGWAGFTGVSGNGTGGTFFPGGGGSGVNRFPCSNPVPRMDGVTSYLVCDNGAVIRTEQAECPSSLPRPEPVAGVDPATTECQYDADCTEMPNGYCSVPNYIGGDAPQSTNAYCSYGCTTDADCSDGSICVCGDPVGHCAQATCTSDADCAPGFHCASHDPSQGCGSEAFACQKSADACLVDADCESGLCAVDEATGVRVCSPGGCAIGRPFLVDDVARVAGTEARTDWLACGLEPRLADLTPELRQRLSREWTRAAQLEHASIAAFARFLMELLAFGAPSELVAETVSAIEDERQHAELCFTLASAYADQGLGPALLDVRGALETPSLARSLATAVREGCIGETVAALEASELAEHVADPLLRQVLERIAADERRHAELAWKFAHWALSQDPGLAALLSAELEVVRDELDAYSPLTLGPHAPELARAGVMPEALRAAVRDAALRQIVEPGLSGMIAHVERASRHAA